MRRQVYEYYTFKLPNISLVLTGFIIAKRVLIEGTETKLL